MKWILTSLFFIWSATALAGGWLLKTGTGYYKTGLLVGSSNLSYDYNGNTYDIPDYSLTMVNVFTQYGLAEGLNMRFSMPVWQSFKLGDQSESGFGDPEIGLIYGLGFSDRVPIAIIVSTRLPIADSGRLGNPIPLGWEEWLVSVGGGLSYGFWEGWYLDLESQFRLRQNNKNNEIRFDSAIGYPITGQFSGKTALAIQFPIGKINATADEINGAGNGLGFVAFIQEVTWMVSDSWGLQYAFLTTAYAQNIAATPLQQFSLVFIR